MKTKTDFVTNSSSTCFVIRDRGKGNYIRPDGRLTKDLVGGHFSNLTAIKVTEESLREWNGTSEGENRFLLSCGNIDIEPLLKSGYDLYTLSVDRDELYTREVQLIRDLKKLGFDVLDQISE